MTAQLIVDEPRDAREVILLAAYRGLPPRMQRAFFDALRRHVDDGQPFEECFAEYLMESGLSRRRAMALLREKPDASAWRALLN